MAGLLRRPRRSAKRGLAVVAVGARDLFVPALRRRRWGRLCGLQSGSTSCHRQLVRMETSSRDLIVTAWCMPLRQ
jgi:hypothetical protein